MTAARWSRLRNLLDRALDGPTERPALLADLSAEDPALSIELESLLAEHDAGTGIIEPGCTAPGFIEHDFIDRMLTDPAGHRVGPYEIVRELGRGGAGTVFLAVRAGDGVRMPVALKLLRHSFLDESAGRTFGRERQALVRLGHPNIAHLIDWGVIEGGLFYLAIEYVEGEPLLDYCARLKLGLSARLALFLDICAAVQHVHLHLLVHRDLKPGNILVSSDGRVKLLDFGIAAALDLAAPPGATLLHRLTPAYASPEQVRGEPATVAADLYSLGAVLYELLAGRLPYRTLDARAVLEDEPATPSRVASLPDIRRSQLAGDLDSILLKALRKEPQERYQSVERMCADLERFQAGLPVLARKGSRLYVAGRFIRRNRVNLALAAIALLALVTGAAVSLWKWRAAENNLAVAERRYRALRSFARAMISNVDASSAASAIEMQRRMSSTAGEYLTQLSRERVADEDLQLEIADAYVRLGAAQGDFNESNQGDPAGALTNYRKAYDIVRDQWMAHHDTASGMRLIDLCLDIAGVLPDPAAAAAFVRERLPIAGEAISLYPNDAGLWMRSAGLYGTGAQRLRSAGDLTGALAMFRRAVDFSKRALEIKPDDAAALHTLETYLSETGSTLRIEGDYLSSLSNQQEARRIALRVLVLKPTAKSRRQAAFKELAMAETLRKLRRNPEAEQNARHALGELEAIAAGDPSNEQAVFDLSLAWLRIGDIESGQGKMDDSLRAHREALRLRRAEYTRRPTAPQALSTYLQSLNREGNLLLAMHRGLPQAREDFDQAIAIGGKLLSETPSDVSNLAQLATAYRGHAEADMRNGRREEATTGMERSLQIWRDVRQRSPLDVDLARETEATLRALGRLRKAASSTSR